jgi:hypothetical protein
MFANLIEKLRRDLPPVPQTRLVNLAAIILRVLRSESLQVGQIITASPLAWILDTLKKRVQRFLKDPGVTVEEYYQPLAQRILQRLAAGGARLHLTLDRPAWSACNVLYVRVRWCERALRVVLWWVLGLGASSFARQQELLEVVASWLPTGALVLLRGDREFGTGVLQCALKRGLSVCLRPRTREYVRQAGTAYFEMPPLVLPGECRFWPSVIFTHKHAVTGLNLAMYWAPTVAEPCYLITTAETCKLACTSYQMRSRIEERFKDFKSDGRGLGLELTGVATCRPSGTPAGDAGPNLQVAVVGAYASATGQQKLVDNVRKPTLSVFQTDLRFVPRLWQQGQLRKSH